MFAEMKLKYAFKPNRHNLFFRKKPTSTTASYKAQSHTSYKYVCNQTNQPLRQHAKQPNKNNNTKRPKINQKTPR